MSAKQSEQVEKTSEFVSGTNTNAEERGGKEIAKPSAACCLTGTIHEGKPRGKTTTVAETETYVVQPPEGKANGHVVSHKAAFASIQQSTDKITRCCTSLTFGVSSTMVF